MAGGDGESVREELDYDVLYRTYRRRVEQLVRRRLPGRHIAEDVVQEVFLRAYRAIDTLDPERSPWPWLRRIAHNVCTDVARSPKTWVERPVDDVGALVDWAAPDHAAAVVGEVLDEARRKLIVDALATLPDRHREALVARAVYGVPSTELAAQQGTTVEAVKSVLKRGRGLFRTAYFQLGNDRGLLPGAPVPVGRLRSAVLRIRQWVGDLARAVGTTPGLESLPALVSTVALLFGFGAEVLAPSAAAAAVLPPIGTSLSAPGALLLAAGAQPPSRTVRPGGGGPPAPPPGHPPPEKPKKPIPADLSIQPSWQHDVYSIYIKDSLNGQGGETYFADDMGCRVGPVSKATCDVLREVGPTDGVVYGRWG
jgi:RNA polymerase sigma factor (sigma-70 family)